MSQACDGIAAFSPPFAQFRDPRRTIGAERPSAQRLASLEHAAHMIPEVHMRMLTKRLTYHSTRQHKPAALITHPDQHTDIQTHYSTIVNLLSVLLLKRGIRSITMTPVLTSTAKSIPDPSYLHQQQHHHFHQHHQHQHQHHRRPRCRLRCLRCARHNAASWSVCGWWTAR